MDKANLRYRILDECRCGPEECFILVSLVDQSAIDQLLGTLSELINDGLLDCFRVGSGSRRLHPSLLDLRKYVKQRIDAGEDLETYPEVVPEYTFMTTESGLAALLPEDRPISQS